MGQQEYDELNKQAEATNVAVSRMLQVLDKMNAVMVEGFENVNNRLAKLDGKDGMQGVSQQLDDIWSELQTLPKT